jgi:4-hydroxy-tetrahydrodipicolinate reductase
MTRIIINGARGRMGQMLIACAARQPALKVVGEIDRDGDLRSALGEADVVIDFSYHAATRAVVEACAAGKVPVVIGTTGHDAGELAAIKSAAAKIPVVLASNFSTGVNTLFWLTRKAAEILGPEFDLEIVETHHRHKADAPSGTARTLAEILAAARSQQLDQVARHGRVGIVGERTPAEIGIHSVRGGDVVGDHTVLFAGIGERVELTHKASTRETFANGALRAAQWLVGRPAGLYDMQDVLGLK